MYGESPYDFAPGPRAFRGSGADRRTYQNTAGMAGLGDINADVGSSEAPWLQTRLGKLRSVYNAQTAELKRAKAENAALRNRLAQAGIAV